MTSKQKQNIFFIKGNTKDANVSDVEVILRTGEKNLRGDKLCLHAQKGPVLFYVWSLNQQILMFINTNRYVDFSE